MNNALTLIKSKMMKYYCHKSIRSFGMSLVDIFLPIYLLTLGLSITMVLLWFLAEMTIKCIIDLCSIPLTSRIGTRRAMLLALFIEMLFFVSLSVISNNIYILLLVALLYAAGNGIYWINELTMFTKIVKKGQEGFRRSVTDTIENIVSLPSPLIGAIILVRFGMTPLSLLAGFIIILSSVPLYFIKGVNFKIKSDVKSLKKYWKRYKLKKKTILQILNRGMQAEFIYIIWPIFLYISGVELIEIGIVGIILGVAELISPLILGKLADHDHSKLMKFTTLGIMICWLIVIFTNNHYILYFISFVVGILNESIWLSINQKMTSLGKKYNASYFGIVHELGDNIAKALLLIIMIPVTIFFGLNATFVAIIFIGLFFILMARDGI